MDRLRRVRLRQETSSSSRRAKPKPFVLYEKSAQGLVIAVANEAARAASLYPGLRLSDARATLPHLLTEEIDRKSDERALIALATRLVRFSPLIALDEADALILETTGCDHLFDGEALMARELSHSLDKAGYGHRLAFAGTRGAAYALAHKKAGVQSPAILPSGDERDGLFDLPVSALRLSGKTLTLLRRFGLTRIGQLYEIDRKALARRFHSHEVAEAVCLRLDQALGKRPEPFEPFRPLPDHSVGLSCPEPLTDVTGINAGLAMLADRLSKALATEGLGAQTFVFRAVLSDGRVNSIGVNTARPVYACNHVLRLFHEKTDRIDPGFGIDTLQLEALRTAPMALGSRPLSGDLVQTDVDESALAILADRINARLGEGSVTVTVPISHHPVDMAEETRPFTGEIPNCTSHRVTMHGLRPIRMFDHPEQVQVISEMPDGPPLRFVWRRVVRRVTRADGPERIAPEWWTYLPPAPGEQRNLPRARDYYRVEDAEGRRYWLFREGLYGDGRGRTPDWFLQGLFA
ncbi:MAG: DNA polymerase Y family protein [Alphaproteobacteria bacterium]|nr:DNA polymerase Y family protein [Alphaproteobacteria bacterium]MBU2085126.1 DNA polymerase Y family protein [Alphaproteobacteria bacterium]MBU2142056.1 DNA polymerase Y family protein [Alphaproteobacteria bacterium]MBU2196948.1 DNA polymerase Y family protein [Alphaproteobacteria bacterium]